jgi:hypothetical protein
MAVPEFFVGGAVVLINYINPVKQANKNQSRPDFVNGISSPLFPCCLRPYHRR